MDCVFFCKLALQLMITRNSSIILRNRGVVGSLKVAVNFL